MTTNNRVEWLLNGEIKAACVVNIFTVFCIAFITCLVVRYIAGCNNNNNNKVILKNMANNNKVEWLLNREIKAACESCKFPRHDGRCGSASSFLNQDEIVILNIGCEYCREEFHRVYGRLCSRTVKLTYEERKPVFDNKEIHPADFKGLSDVQSQIKSLPSTLRFSPIPDDEFKRQLKDSVHIMSSSGQHLWKTMFGNVEKSIHLLWKCRNSSHLLIHQMAYFLRAVDVGDKAIFLRRGEGCLYAQSWIRMEDVFLLFPSIGFYRIKARIVDNEKQRSTLDLAFLLFALKYQRELEQAEELDKDQVRELACKYGVPYVYVNSYPSMFSLDGFCPLKRTKISTPNSSSRFQLNSSSRLKLRTQNVRAIVQLVHKKEVHSKNIEVSINVRNVRCHILSDIACDQEKYFPSRIQIRVIPSKDCEKRTQFLTVGKSSNDAPRTLSKEEQWEAGIQLPKGPVDLKMGGKFGSSATHTNWRFEMNGCSDNSNAGHFEWTLFDNANGIEVWSADCSNYKQLTDRGSSLRNRGSHLSSPFTRDGGCIFSEDLYGQPLTWSLDKRVEGMTSSWRVEMDVWLTYCYNVSRNDYFETASWSFTESLEMKL